MCHDIANQIAAHIFNYLKLYNMHWAIPYSMKVIVLKGMYCRSRMICESNVLYQFSYIYKSSQCRSVSRRGFSEGSLYPSVSVCFHETESTS